MKISKETLAILKNFATINGNIKVKEGSDLKTIAPSRNVLATAKATETFPVEFCIYDLGAFLNCVTLFEDADLDFQEGFVTISANNTKLKYKYSSPSIIVSPEKDIVIEDEPDVVFDLTNDDLTKLFRGSEAVAGDFIKVSTAGNKIFFEALDEKTTVNTFKMAIQVEGDLKEGQYNLKRKNMNFLPDDYKVTIWEKGISKFEGKTIPVTYFVALERE